MKAVIAEKPSVAREIALLLGATHKEEGCITGNGYIVTWAFGHLVSLGMPEDYGISGFQRESLPILPNPFILNVRKTKRDKTLLVDTGIVKQLKIIEKVFDRCESIIVATDAGREGELIFRYIYEYLKCSKPFERLWISSLTEKAIKQGFENLKPGKEFDGLFLAAKARSHADWLIGINSSQALSVTEDSGVYSLGRVQTPVLAMICKRYLDNKKFEVQRYWQIQLDHQKDFIHFKSLSNIKWNNKKEADDAFKSVQRNGIATVTIIESKNITEHPPLLFDLTGLQKEANTKLNFSAEETLNITQSLYEKKFITYPRTGSKYIPEDIWYEIPNLLRMLEDWAPCKEPLSTIKRGRLNKRMVNDLKVTDHHGLLTTDKIPSALSAKESSIYNMIALRLLEGVSPACSKEITDISLQVLHYDFTLKGCKILVPGWRAIKGVFSEQDNEATEALPEIKIGCELKIKDFILLDKETNPPVLYTEAGLLAAMESVGKEINDTEERRALTNLGIGTPATRATIIEILFSRDYIIRERKSLIPTRKGLQVYELVKDKKIADVAMTAAWEVALQKIENHSLDAGIFHKEMEEYTISITRELLSASIVVEKLPILICPKCKSHQLRIKDKIVKCPEDSCKWVQFRTICGVQLSVANIEELTKKGKTSLISGMKSKSGKKFNAYIILNTKAESSFEFEKNSSRIK